MNMLASDGTLHSEPAIHSHITDGLSDGHPLQHVTVCCAECQKMVHCENNECMRTWFEFSDANVCARCVGSLALVLYSNTWEQVKAAPKDDE